MTDAELLRLKRLCRDVYAMTLDFPDRGDYKTMYDLLSELYNNNLPKPDPVASTQEEV